MSILIRFADVARGAAIPVLLAIALAVSLPAPAPALPWQAEGGALAAYREGRYEEAINTLRQRIRVAQAAAEDHRLLTDILHEVGRYDEAEAVARAYIEAHPDSVELHNSLGEALWATGSLDEAEAAFRRAAEGGAADRLTAELNLAIAAYYRGRRPEAMQRFDRFIDVYNAGAARSADDLIAVGVACSYLGIDDSELFQDALKAFDEAAAADPGALRPKILSGQLFLDRNEPADAATDLAPVLRLNPSHPEALLASARRMHFDNEPGVAEVVGRALEINPNLVPARVFRGQQLLALERYEEAIAQAELALEVNPAALEALATLATAHYLEGDDAAYAAARDRALAINPGYADLYNILADLLVQNRHYDQAVDFARQATVLDPQSWRGYAILGVNQLRIGDIEGGRRSLETSFAGDRSNVWVMNTLDLLDTFPDYVESSTGRFDLMIEQPEAGLLSLYIGRLAEEAYDYFEARYGYSPPTPIRIEVYPSHADFSVRTVGLTGLGALGVSFGPVIAIDSPSARELGEFNWGSTLWHEIAHTFTLGATDFKIPRWFSEGLSVYEERRARPSWGDDVSISFLIAHLRGQLLPIGSITEGFVRPSYPEQVVHAYFQASLVCELIDRDFGFEAILGLLGAYKRGVSTDDAFEEVLGIDLAAFDARFAAYLEEVYGEPLAALRPALEGGGEGPARMGMGRPSAAELRRNAEERPDDFLAQLAYGTALVDEGRQDEATRYLEAAKRLFPFYAEANSPYWNLAMIAKQAGDLRRAAAELEALTAINEKDYRANVELAALQEELGEPRRAAEALERTVYIYPLEIPLHQQLADLYAGISEHELAVRERQAVVGLAPVDMAEALYQLARAQQQAGDPAGAKRSVLGALEIAPGYPAAQRLLLDLVGGSEARR
jgi:tetratricopeptide (TPR) repeat protein